jgi:Zn-dependent protease
MYTRPRSPKISLGRDQIFWLVAGTILLVYALVALDTVSFVATLISLLLAITFHECAHAWTANQLGDPTGRSLGRVSLNPLVHLDPLGTIMMVVTALTGMGIGWGKPVPVSPYRLKYGPHLGNGLVALAGPAANLLVATLVGLLLRFLPMAPAGLAWLYAFLSTFVWINILIALFNLLPVPPLDGYSVLIGLVSLIRAGWATSVIRALSSLERYGSLILIGLLILPQLVGRSLLGGIIGPPSEWLFGAITGWW